VPVPGQIGSERAQLPKGAEESQEGSEDDEPPSPDGHLSSVFGGMVLRRRTGGFRPDLMSTKSLVNDLDTGMRVPVDHMASHAGTRIGRTMRQILSGL
jgi:hypothetical protein